MRDDHLPEANTSAHIAIRAMRAADLDALVELDASVFGEPRPAYFEQRLATVPAAGRPTRTIGLVAEQSDAPGRLLGLVMGTVTHGEFGFTQATALMDSIAVHPEHRREHIGHQLATAFLETSAAHGAREIYTLVNWNAWDLLRFFDALGFGLAQTVPLRRTIS
jgi:ribosomal protein S18 acetylase RimI-like enzyme